MKAFLATPTGPGHSFFKNSLAFCGFLESHTVLSWFFFLFFCILLWSSWSSSFDDGDNSEDIKSDEGGCGGEEDSEEGSGLFGNDDGDGKLKSSKELFSQFKKLSRGSSCYGGSILNEALRRFCFCF